MRIAAAVLCGFFMDLCLGDPDWMPHPVIYMGKAISALEKFLRRRFPDTQKGLLMAGAALAAILPLGSFLMAAAAIYLAGLVHPVLAFLLETLWCWQALAVKGLYTESMRVKKKLEEQDLPGARSAVARIVGRDTQNLDAAGVAKAAIETVAENFSDGVAAPLFYLVIGGAPLGLCYKAINTMDSMVGYKNDRKSQQALCQLSPFCCSAKQQDSELFLPACPIDRHPLFIAALCHQQTVLKACPAAANKDRRKHIHLLFGKLLQRAGFLFFILPADHPHPATRRIRRIIF